MAAVEEIKVEAHAEVEEEEVALVEDHDVVVEEVEVRGTVVGTEVIITLAKEEVKKMHAW